MNYKNVNDYELLYLIGEDSDDYYDILLKKYLPMIKSLARKYLPMIECYGGEMQDLIQEGYLGLNNAIMHYRENQNSLFYTYARLCVDRKMLGYVKMLTAKKNIPLAMSISDDHFLFRNIRDNSYESLFYQFQESDLEEVFSQCICSLDLTASCVLELRFNGFTYREISLLLDISKGTVEKKLFQARRRMQKLLESYF